MLSFSLFFPLHAWLTQRSTTRKTRSTLRENQNNDENDDANDDREKTKHYLPRNEEDAEHRQHTTEIRTHSR